MRLHLVCLAIAYWLITCQKKSSNFNFFVSVLLILLLWLHFWISTPYFSCSDVVCLLQSFLSICGQIIIFLNVIIIIFVFASQHYALVSPEIDFVVISDNDESNDQLNDSVAVQSALYGALELCKQFWSFNVTNKTIIMPPKYRG